MNLHIRMLEANDAAVIAAAFDELGWNKPLSQYQQYFAEQQAGDREVLVAFVDTIFAGYVTIVWQTHYQPFREQGVPEVKDFNVLPQFRRRGIGTALMDEAEARISQRSPMVGIGVGMHAGYGNAQRLYVKRGYVPDGRGLTYDGEVIDPFQATINDDNLVLFFTKRVSG